MEDAIVEDLVVRLKAASAFDAVYGTAPWETLAPDSLNRVAWVEWVETSESPVTNSSIDATGTFKIWIVAKAGDDNMVTRRRLMRMLANVAKNAVNGKSIASITEPAFSRVMRTKYGYMLAGPGRLVELDYQCRFRIASDSARDVTNNT